MAVAENKAAEFRPLGGKKVLLGVSGSIAAYKATELASLLVKNGAEVQVLMTRAARRFITPLTLEAITQKPVVRNMFSDRQSINNHVALAQWADIFVVAPASCNTIAKLSLGLADDAISCTNLAFAGAKLIAPAMETNMYQHDTVQQHLENLEETGWYVVGPEFGRLASGADGLGRMTEPQKLYQEICWQLGRGGDLAGKKLVITAGGTRERLDDVRFMSNASSGKMGYAIAEAASLRGADVVLISTVTEAHTVSKQVTHLAVESAAEMQAAVTEQTADADWLIMAAAVADFKFKSASAGKLDKSDVKNLATAPNPDIVAEATGAKLQKVAFSLTSGADEKAQVKAAASKAKAKGVRFIVLNDVADGISGFGSDRTKVKFVTPSGEVADVPAASKLFVANEILNRIAEISS